MTTKADAKKFTPIEFVGLVRNGQSGATYRAHIIDAGRGLELDIRQFRLIDDEPPKLEPTMKGITLDKASAAALVELLKKADGSLTPKVQGQAVKK